jgi:hypothetical protein
MYCFSQELPCLENIYSKRVMMYSFYTLSVFGGVSFGSVQPR